MQKITDIATENFKGRDLSLFPPFPLFPFSIPCVAPLSFLGEESHEVAGYRKAV